MTMMAEKESKGHRVIGAETATATATGTGMKKPRTANPVGNTAIVTITAGTVAIAHPLHNKNKSTTPV